MKLSTGIALATALVTTPVMADAERASLSALMGDQAAVVSTARESAISTPDAQALQQRHDELQKQLNSIAEQILSNNEELLKIEDAAEQGAQDQWMQENGGDLESVQQEITDDARKKYTALLGEDAGKGDRRLTCSDDKDFISVQEHGKGGQEISLFLKEKSGEKKSYYFYDREVKGPVLGTYVSVGDDQLNIDPEHADQVEGAIIAYNHIINTALKAKEAGDCKSNMDTTLDTVKRWWPKL